MTFEPTIRDPTSSSASSCAHCNELRATLRILAQQMTEEIHRIDRVAPQDFWIPSLTAWGWADQLARHCHGESCAVGSYFDVNPNLAYPGVLTDEVAAVNDSMPEATPRARKLMVLRWLRWKLNQAGMPGFTSAKP